jgi:LysR family transcriptional regulator, cyn operon transcriptional activator
MELNQLRSFICVATVGSFTEAAEQLSLSQPALSLQIKALEQELGQQVFERRNRTIYLTEAGRILLDRGRQAMDLLEQTRQELDALAGLAHGRLRIGAGDTVCLYLFPPVVRAFRAAYPGIELHLTNRPSSEIVALLQAGEIDFGVATLPLAAADLDSKPLLRRRDVLICAPGHPLAQSSAPTLADLCQYNLLLLDPTSTSRLLLDRLLREAGLQPQISDLGSVEVIKRYVAIGLGISIAPAFAVVGEVERGELHAVPLPWLPPIQIGIVTRRKGVRSPAAQAFLALLETDMRSRNFNMSAG